MQAQLQKLSPTINGNSNKATDINIELDMDTMKLIYNGPRNGEELETWEEDVHCLKCHDKIQVEQRD